MAFVPTSMIFSTYHERVPLFCHVKDRNGHPLTAEEQHLVASSWKSTIVSWFNFLSKEAKQYFDCYFIFDSWKCLKTINYFSFPIFSQLVSKRQKWVLFSPSKKYREDSNQVFCPIDYPLFFTCVKLSPHFSLPVIFWRKRFIDLIVFGDLRAKEWQSLQFVYWKPRHFTRSKRNLSCPDRQDENTTTIQVSIVWRAS